MNANTNHNTVREGTERNVRSVKIPHMGLASHSTTIVRKTERVYGTISRTTSYVTRNHAESANPGPFIGRYVPAFIGRQSKTLPTHDERIASSRKLFSQGKLSDSAYLMVLADRFGMSKAVRILATESKSRLDRSVDAYRSGTISLGQAKGAYTRYLSQTSLTSHAKSKLSVSFVEKL